MIKSNGVNDLRPTKDPRGLVRADLMLLRQVFKERPIKPTLTQNEIMFHAGQQSVLRYIEEQLVK